MEDLMTYFENVNIPGWETLLVDIGMGFGNVSD
jgi:hypothetical protein